MVVARDGLTLGELPGRQPGRHRVAAPGRPAARPRPRFGDRRRSAATWTPGSARSATGEYDAVVLARAGLARLGRLDEATEVLDPLQMLPAPGQGALAVECRDGRRPDATSWPSLDDPHTRAAVTAERAVLATLEGGCSAPVGALAEVVEGDDGDELWVRAVALSPDGALAVRMSATGDPADAAGVGSRLASEMLDEGAAQLTEPSKTPHEQPVTDCERQDA